jgi:hypothetical protein
MEVYIYIYNVSYDQYKKKTTFLTGFKGLNEAVLFFTRTTEGFRRTGGLKIKINPYKAIIKNNTSLIKQCYFI